MKARVDIVAYYEVPDDHLLDAYGTVVPEECVKIDGENEPSEMLQYCDGVTMKITVLP